MLKNTRPEKTEKEITGELEVIAISEGGNISSPIILTKNGQYLHNHATEAVIAEGDITLCDCGAQTDTNYSGEMTRTFPAGSRFFPVQKEVYEIVLKVHNSALEMLNSAVSFMDVHLYACTKLDEGLKGMGLMRTKNIFQSLPD